MNEKLSPRRRDATTLQCKDHMTELPDKEHGRRIRNRLDVKAAIVMFVTLLLIFEISCLIPKDADNDLDSKNLFSSSSYTHESNGTKESGRGTRNSDSLWHMIDLSTPGVCGHSKCFFKSKENPDEVGYAVSSYHPATMRWVWNQAQMLEEKYGSRHVYLEGPQTLKVSRDLLSIFRSLREQNFDVGTMHQDLHLKDFIHFADPRGPDDEEKMTIQKLRTIPRPFLEIGHSDRRKNFVKSEWDAFIETIPDERLFSKRLLEECDKLEELLRVEPWLKMNFQILIDNEGRIFHFDLDRSYHADLEYYANKDISKYLIWIRDIANEV